MYGFEPTLCTRQELQLWSHTACIEKTFAVHAHLNREALYGTVFATSFRSSHLLLIFYFLFIFAVRSQGTVVDPDLRRLCNAQSTCRECIQASPSCTWCADQVSLVYTAARRAMPRPA